MKNESQTVAVKPAKIILGLLFSLILFALLSLPAAAALYPTSGNLANGGLSTEPPMGFSGSSTYLGVNGSQIILNSAVATNIQSFVVPVSTGAPRVTYLQAAVNTNFGTLKFWVPIPGQIYTLVSNTTSTNIALMGTTNPIGAGSLSNSPITCPVVIRYKTNELYQRSYIFVGGTTNLLTIPSAPPGAGVQVGDIIYFMTNVSSIPIGGTVGSTNTYNVPGGGGVFVGVRGQPLLVETVSGTNQTQGIDGIYQISGDYLK